MLCTICRAPAGDTAGDRLGDLKIERERESVDERDFFAALSRAPRLCPRMGENFIAPGDAREKVSALFWLVGNIFSIFVVSRDRCERAGIDIECLSMGVELR